MQTRVSTKGQVVLPGPIRRKLGLCPGDTLEASVRDGQVVLTPHHRRTAKPAIRRDPITGLPVLSAAAGVPPLSSEQVEDILSNLP